MRKQASRIRPEDISMPGRCIGTFWGQDRDFQEEKTVSVFMERQEQPKQASEPDITPGFQLHSRTEPEEGEKNGTGDSRKKKPWWALELRLCS